MGTLSESFVNSIGLSDTHSQGTEASIGAGEFSMQKRACWIAIGGLIVGLGCGGSPTMPTDTNRATHLMHVQAASACAGVLPKNIPVQLWAVPLQSTADGSHLTG